MKQEDTMQEKGKASSSSIYSNTQATTELQMQYVPKKKDEKELKNHIHSKQIHN